VIVEKLVGSLAESGADLEQCKAFGDRINRHTASMGVAFSSCTVSAMGTLTFKIGDDEIEVLINGLGGTPLGELYLLFNSARLSLQERGLDVARVEVGSLRTSLEMAGARSPCAC